MRAARDQGLLKSKNGKLMGLNLGADYCAEHEFGIKEIKKSFGMGEDEKLLGIERRIMTKFPMFKDWGEKEERPCLLFNEGKTDTALILSNRIKEIPEDKKARQEVYSRFELRTFLLKEKPFVSAWDESSFGVVSGLPEGQEAIKKVWYAAQSNNLAIWLGGGGIFQNAGLVLAIVSEIPEELKKTLRDADIDAADLKAEAEETGIYKALEKAGCRYFACSPKWASEEDKKRTNHPVVFWLNPMEQQKNNYGWFTVEDLELWALGKGPIPMREGKKA